MSARLLRHDAGEIPKPSPGSTQSRRLELGLIPARRISLLYRSGLIVAAAAMLILPLVYVALAVSTGWGVYLFAVHCVPAIWSWQFTYSQFEIISKFVCMVTPLVAGSAIAFFMVKPIFTPRGRPPVAAVLNPSFEPRVAEFINAVCRAVGAPAPRRIELACDINASAGFDIGWGGLLKNRLVLRLGLPLVATLTERQLAGLLAHEFGHFRQGAGMRLSYLIRSVNGWFAQVIYGRDRWDDAIEAGNESEFGWLAFMSVFASIGIAISRGVLWLLMMAGHGVSAFLMRQMEYDADRAEIQLVGSDAFKSTMRKVATLQAMRGGIDGEVSQMWQNTRSLPDDLSLLIAARERGLPDDVRAAFEASLEATRTHWADTHPSPHDRMTFAARLGQAGINLSDASARHLFEDFADISRAVTIGHYHNLGVANPMDRVVSVAALLSGNAAANASPARAVPPRAPIPFNCEAAV